MSSINFNQEKLKIQIQSNLGESLYEISLKRFESDPNILEIILDISQQKWCNSEILESLVKILDEVCSQTDNSLQPGIFCPFGLIPQISGAY